MKYTNNLFTRTFLSFCSLLLILSIGGQTALLAFGDKSNLGKNTRSRTDNSKENTEAVLSEGSVIPAVDFGFFNPKQTRNANNLSPQLVGTDQGSEREPNDTFSTANVLTGTEGKINGRLYNSTPGYTPATAGVDTDFYSFTTLVPNSKIYAATIDSAATSQDTILAVIASDGTTVLETDDQDGSFGGSSSSIAGTTLLLPGTYYLRVTNFSTTAPIAPYDLYFAVRAGGIPTPETEPNNNGTPQALPVTQYVSGAIDPVGDTDTFSFNANAGDTVFISQDLDPERDVTNFNGRIGIGLFGTPTTFLVTSDAGTGDTIDSEAMVMTVSTTGTYQVYVDAQTAGQGGPTATYAFNVTTIPAAAAGTCTTYTNAVSTPLPDLALTTSTITIPDSRIIRSLRVITNITHANYPDLDVHLRSPANNDNGLYTDVGVATQTGAQIFNLRDEAALPVIFTIVNGAIFKPEPAYRLNWFNGENSLGTWSLDIRDDLTANAGTLNSWSLEVCEEAAPVGTLIYNENFEASNGGYTLTNPIPTAPAQAANEWAYGTPNTPAQTTTSPFIAPFIGCASGINCWKTDLLNTYEISSNQDLTSPVLNLTQYTGTFRLYWQQRYQMESVSFDHIFVRVTEVGNPANSRVVWQNDNATMSETVGSGASLANTPESAGWGRYNADISDFAGRRIQVTFHLDSDSSVNLGGYAIDDVQIRQVGTVAANVGVSGRVSDASGNALARTIVTLTGANGISRSVKTNTFGYYHFDNVGVGETYILNATRKGYDFAPRVITVQEDVADADLTAME